MALINIHEIPPDEKTMTAPLHLSIDDTVARIAFDRPGALNAVDLAMAEAFEAAVARVLSTPGVRVLVLSGRGRGFMAGGDLAAFRTADDPPELARAIIAPLHRALLALHDAPLLTLALLHGPVAGAGLSLALAADLALADETAVMSFAYLRIGAPADCGITWTLPRIVGLRRALWLAVEGSAVRAPEALAMGLVNEIVAPEALEERGMALAARLAGTAPGAAADLRRMLRDSFGRDFATALDDEMAGFVRAAGTADFTEALAAFFEKRPARFTGA